MCLCVSVSLCLFLSVSVSVCVCFCLCLFYKKILLTTQEVGLGGLVVIVTAAPLGELKGDPCHRDRGGTLSPLNTLGHVVESGIGVTVTGQGVGAKVAEMKKKREMEVCLGLYSSGIQVHIIGEKSLDAFSCMITSTRMDMFSL